MATNTEISNFINNKLLAFLGNFEDKANGHFNLTKKQMKKLDARLDKLKDMLGDDNPEALDIWNKLKLNVDKHDDGKHGGVHETKAFFKGLDGDLKDIKNLVLHPDQDPVVVTVPGDPPDPVIVYVDRDVPGPVVIVPGDPPDPIIIDHIVEVPVQPDPPDLVPQTQLNSVLDVGATSGGFMQYGGGNSADDMQIQETDLFEVGLKGKYRQGDDTPAVTVDQFGVVHFDSGGGMQVIDPAHNVPSANPNRTADSFDYSIFVKSGTIEGFLLDHEVKLQIDIDPSEETDYVELFLDYDAVAGTGGADTVWKDKDGNIGIGDDGGDSDTSQNSQNWAFYSALIDGDPNTDGVQAFDFEEGILNVNLVVTEISSGDVLANVQTAHHLGGYGLDLYV